MFGNNKHHQVDMELFVMFDSKTSHYDEPWFSINQHDMVRRITNQFSGPQASQSKYFLNAEDYSLFRVGTWDKKTGELVACKPEHIANMHDLRALVQQKGIETT